MFDGNGLQNSIRFCNFETSLPCLTFDETVLLDIITQSLFGGVSWNFCLCQAINMDHRSSLLLTHKRHDARFNQFLHHFAFAAMERTANVPVFVLYEEAIDVRKTSCCNKKLLYAVPKTI